MGWVVPHATTDTALEHLFDVTGAAATVLLGRKNYVGFGGYWPPIADDESADASSRAIAQWLNSVEKVVFSSTLQEATWENSRIADDDPAAVVDELREAGSGDVVVLASVSIIRELLREDRLDRLSVTLCPEVVGGGARLFEEGLPPSSWTLRRSKTTESGALCLLYDCIRDGDE